MVPQLPAAVARPIACRVERDHIFIPRKLAPVAGNRGEPIISSRSRLLDQEVFRVALPAHPYFFHLS